MEVDKLESVDYLHYMNNILRVAHETDTITPVPEISKNYSKTKENDAKVEREIRRRKRIMAGLNREIKELQRLKE